MACVAEETSTQPLLERVRYNERGYSAVEEAIARAIVSDPRSVTGSTIDAFAGRIGVSAGSVVRFAKQFGFHGYRDLRLALAAEAGGLPQEQRSRPRAQVQELLEMQVRAVRLAAESVVVADFDTAADLIVSARSVDVVGVGAARATAQAALFQLSILGVHCRALDDPSEAAAAAGFLGRGDLLLAVSHSGRTREIVDAAQRARAGGAAVVAVTSSPRSPLATSATIVLGVDSARTRYGSDEAPFRVAHLAIVQALCAEVRLRLPPSDLARRQARWAEARFAMRYDPSPGRP